MQSRAKALQEARRAASVQVRVAWLLGIWRREAGAAELGEGSPGGSLEVNADRAYLSEVAPLVSILGLHARVL